MPNACHAARSSTRACTRRLFSTLRALRPNMQAPIWRLQNHSQRILRRRPGRQSEPCNSPLLREEAKRRQGGSTKFGSCAPEQEPQTKALTGNVRDIAGTQLGVSGYTVQRAMNVKEADPELFEKVKQGTVTEEAQFFAASGAEQVPHDRVQSLQLTSGRDRGRIG